MTREEWRTVAVWGDRPFDSRALQQKYKVEWLAGGQRVVMPIDEHRTIHVHELTENDNE